MIEVVADRGLGIIGLISGLVCVWLLLRQNILTFPIGLIYASVTVVVMTEKKLYADVLLHAYFVAMNAYGWYYWRYGGRDGRASSKDRLPVAETPRKYLLPLAAITVAGSATMGWSFDTYTGAHLAYWDSATTVMSFVAMWMTARKYLENWWVWIAVNVNQIALYLIKGLPEYALLYAVYLGMCIAGWLAWRRSMVEGGRGVKPLQARS